MPQVDILYLSDRMHIDDAIIPPEITDALKHQGFVNPESRKIHFCGLVRVDRTLTVFLPRNNAHSVEPAGRVAYYLLRALAKFYRTRDTGIHADGQDELVTGGASLSTSVALLEDYMCNGLYVRRTRIRTTNDGKVSWPRTAARSSAYPSASGPIYLELCTSRTLYKADCMTARIHAAVMRELLASLGMLWLGKSYPSDQQLVGTPPPAGSHVVWITHLQKELQVSYSERDIFLIRSLKAYLENKKGTEQGQLLIGVHKFHGLWEAMLDECLVGKLRVNDRLPVPAYLNDKGKIELVAGKGQRTDTVLRSSDKHHIAIIDAKYYEAGSPKSAPGWPDLVKQFFYQQVVRNLYPDEHISNHFVFPGNAEKNLKAAFVAERDSKPTSPADCLAGYGPINCHYQDPLELLRLYATGDKLIKLTKEIFASGAAVLDAPLPSVLA